MDGTAACVQGKYGGEGEEEFVERHDGVGP